MTFQDLIPLYDFSLIEKAVQQFFCAIPQSPFIQPDPKWDAPEGGELGLQGGQIAFYTAFQASTLVKARPRIGIALHSINEFEGQRIVDAQYVLRATAWRAQMRFGIVTKPDYDAHRLLRAAVNAIIPTCQPTYQPDGSGIATGGLNGILQYHEVGQFQMQNESTAITPQEGAYVSTLTVNLTFSVKATVWPGGNPITN